MNEKQEPTVTQVAVADPLGLKWELYLVNGGKLEKHLLQPGTWTLGRDSASTIVIREDDRISRVHAIFIIETNRTFRLINKSFIHPVQVNNRELKIDEVIVLAPGDMIAFTNNTFARLHTTNRFVRPDTKR